MWAVFPAESTEWFPVTVSKRFVKPVVAIPVAPVIASIIMHFMFHVRCISIQINCCLLFFLLPFEWYFVISIIMNLSPCMPFEHMREMRCSSTQSQHYVQVRGQRHTRQLCPREKSPSSIRLTGLSRSGHFAGNQTTNCWPSSSWPNHFRLRYPGWVIIIIIIIIIIHFSSHLLMCQLNSTVANYKGSTK